MSKKKVLAFAASSSQKSINKQLVGYVSRLISSAEVEILDLNDFEMPLYSEDKEKQIGRPQAVEKFLKKIQEADYVLISFAEHNGSYAVAYKNIFDWCSRSVQKVYENKKVILMSTSPGSAGGKNVLEAAVKSMPFFGAQVLGHISVPRFYENFDLEKQVPKNQQIADQLKQLVESLQ